MVPRVDQSQADGAAARRERGRPIGRYASRRPATQSRRQASPIRRKTDHGDRPKVGRCAPKAKSSGSRNGRTPPRESERLDYPNPISADVCPDAGVETARAQAAGQTVQSSADCPRQRSRCPPERRTSAGVTTWNAGSRGSSAPGALAGRAGPHNDMRRMSQNDLNKNHAPLSRRLRTSSLIFARADDHATFAQRGGQPTAAYAPCVQ